MSVFKRYIGSDNAEPTSPVTPVSEPRAPEPTPTPTTSATAPASRPASGTRNILSSDVDIKGMVKFTNDLVIDGKIEGEINSNGNLTVGENARIKAEIKTATVVVYGKVHGNITAADRVDLKSTAEVVGDIKAKILAVEPGATFVGKSTVGAPESVATQPVSPAKPAAAPPAPTPTKPGQPEVKQATLPGTQV